MSTGGRDRGSRAERERARAYQARLSLHQAKIGRRRRDNIVAAIAGGVLILGIAGAQIAFYTAGPGMPQPTPTPASSETPLPSPTAPLAPVPATTPTP